jgi:hypothetical protein
MRFAFPPYGPTDLPAKLKKQSRAARPCFVLTPMRFAYFLKFFSGETTLVNALLPLPRILIQQQ